MANLEIKLSANKRQPYLRHRVVGRVGDGGLTTINVQLLEEDEITPFVINLNGTLKFVGEVSNGNYTEGEPEIIDSTNGLISYTFTKSNFSTSHQFKQAYFEYVDPNGKKVTFQNFIIDVLERVDINSEQAKYYISSLEKLQSEMQTTFNQFISDKQVQYDQIYSKYNELVRLINESDKQVNDRIDQTNQQIGDLGKLKKMYSNSIDFGDYDYSGNPNLFVNKLESSDFIKGNHGSLTDDNGILHFTSDGTGLIDRSTLTNMPAVVSGKTYTISAKLRFDEGTTGDINKLRLTYRKESNGTVLLEANNTAMTVADLGKEITIKGTAMVTYNITELTRMFLSVSFSQNGKINGGFKLYDIKIEEGSTATPYQPNLIEEPYRLSKVPLGENIKDKGTVFPIKTSAHAVYSGANTEPYIAGQKYTLTMKATKPATQTFNVYLNFGTIGVGSMTPVEGLTDVWQKTFTVSQAHIDAGATDRLAIYQASSSSIGAVQIDWLKIEKGDTRTPNISEYKYFGEGLKDSNNPNDYSWDITAEYTEKSLNNTVSLTEPETVLGLKNFIDGIQVDGKDVRTKYSLSWTKIAISGKATSNYFYVRRDGDIITFSGQLTIEPISSWSENIIGNLIEEFYVSVIPGLNTITWDAISEDGKTHALARITKDGKLAIMQTYGDVTTAKSYWITQSFPAAISFE
ncbi:BppU family phage baseplate upper protein [Enterococcus faecium]